MKCKDYGSEYPYIPWRGQYRRLINTMILSIATIIVFMAVLVAGIVMLPGAVEKEIIRQVAVVEKSLGGGGGEMMERFDKSKKPTRIIEQPFKVKNTWMLKTDVGIFNIEQTASLRDLHPKTLYHRLFKNLYWNWSDPDIFGPQTLKKWKDKTPTRMELECKKLGPRRESHDIKIGSWERRQLCGR